MITLKLYDYNEKEAGMLLRLLEYGCPPCRFVERTPSSCKTCDYKHMCRDLRDCCEYLHDELAE